MVQLKKFLGQDILYYIVKIKCSFILEKKKEKFKYYIKAKKKVKKKLILFNVKKRIILK